jgi:hypothetical protein
MYVLPLHGGSLPQIFSIHLGQTMMIFADIEARQLPKVAAASRLP